MTTSSTDDDSAPTPEPATPPSTDTDAGAGTGTGTGTGTDGNADADADADRSTDGHANADSDADRDTDADADRGDRRNGAAVLAVALAVVSAVVTALVTPLGDQLTHAFFDEPTCPGEACDGKNPQNQGCNEDARTFKPGGGNPAVLQLRYSENCRAVWAKIERGSPGDLVTVHVTGRAERTAEINYGHDQFTGMVGVKEGDFQVTACAIPKTGGDSTYEKYCIHGSEVTAWR